MSNDLIKQRNWLQRNWKWALPTTVVAFLSATLFFSLTSGHLGDFGHAYSDPQLFGGAIIKVQENEKATVVLGEILPVDRMAILEGDVKYTNQNKNVQFSVRIKGANGKAIMDVEAERSNDIWEYKKITIRIKNPPEKRQTISVLE